MRSKKGRGVTVSAIVAAAAAAGESCADRVGPSPGWLSLAGGVNPPGADKKPDPKRPREVAALMADARREGSSTEARSPLPRPNRLLTPVAAADAAATARPASAGGAPPPLEDSGLGSAAVPPADTSRCCCTGLALVVPAGMRKHTAVLDSISGQKQLRCIQATYGLSLACAQHAGLAQSTVPGRATPCPAAQHL